MIGATASERPDAPAVEARDLTKVFGDMVAVDRVSFAVEPGEIFAFLGPNGSGKSTTIRMLCGILTPSAGEGWVLGLSIAHQSEAIRQHLGYMSQRFALYDDLTARENLRFYSGAYGVARHRLPTRLDEVLEITGLTTAADAPAGALATGWRQRLALGCAILHQPRVLFLDEPTAGVDPLARRRFWDLIYTLAGTGVTVFVTTHAMDEAEQADRVSLMRAGRLIAIDTPAGLRARVAAGTLWEVETATPLAAVAALLGRPGVADVTLHGVVLHMRTTAPLASDGAAALLRSAGVEPVALAAIPASLEDVFIALIAASEQGDNPAADA